MAGIRQESFSHHLPSGTLLPGVIGSSPAMVEVARITKRVAPSNASVLLLGETGTGKEVIANAIHQLSGRNGAPFVKVNCEHSAKSSGKRTVWARSWRLYRSDIESGRKV